MERLDMQKNLTGTIFYILFLSFTLYSQSNSESTLRVTVKVFDQDKNKLDGIDVIYTDMHTNQVYSKTTRKGNAEFSLELKREYLIVVSNRNYYTKTILIETEVSQPGYQTAFYSDIDVNLFLNCEKDPSKAHILDMPIGKIVYDKVRQNFQYDYAYTSAMTQLYNDIVSERCSLAEELDEDNWPSGGEEDDLAEEEKDIIVEQNNVSPDKDIIDQNKSQGKKPKIFDETKAFIYIQPKHGWPSELRNYLLDPKYVSRPIGTFAYTENEEKKDFHIENVPELRLKFPKQFDVAFPNWDYIYSTYSSYKK